MTYSDDWDYYAEEPGVYSFKSVAPISFQQVFVSEDYRPSGGAFFTDKYYILTTVSEDWFTGQVDVVAYKYSRGDWQEISYRGQDIYSLYNCICYDPIDDRAYGFFYGDNGGNWGYMDPNNLTVTAISELQTSLVAVAIDAAGQAYGISSEGKLFKINKSTGELSLIGATGLTPEYMQSTAFGLDGKLYWAASEEYASGLYIVDTATGVASLVGSFNGTEEVCALYPVFEAASNNVPAMATDLTADVSGIALTFPFSFKLPSKTIGGQPLNGSLDYTIRVDGTEVLSGSSEAGATASHTLTVETPGFHLFSVTVTNAAGESEAAMERLWIGVDQPEQVSNAVVEKLSDSSIKISWDAPAKGVNGGYFSEDLITYSVKRLPDGVMVADNLTETSFTDQIDLESGQMLVRYEITPYAQTLAGGKVTTEGIVMGNAYLPPVEFNFDSQEDYNIFTVIDNNETLNLDSGMWQFTPSGEAAGYVGGTKDGDDWLITPSVRLKARTQYIFSHDVLCYSDTWPEEYSVYMGTAPTIAGMTTEVVPTTTIWWDEYRTRKEIITVPEDGVYYFGFHATSEAGSVFFLIDNIKIEESYKLDAPAAATQLKVEAGELGAKKATLEFVTPLNTVNGDELDDDLIVKICRDGLVIKTFYDVAPDEKMTYEDNSPADRAMNEYEVICSTWNGAGPAASASVWVGVDAPEAPENATVILNEAGNPVISWEKPSGRGIHGGYVNNDDLLYTVANIKNGELSPVAEDISALSCTDAGTVLENTGAQAMHQYYIVPKSNDGAGYGNNATALYISGKPYALPFKESFANRKPTNFWALTSTSDEGWYIGDDFSVGSYDNDDGVLTYIPAQPEVTATAMSGKTNIVGANNPQLSFYLRKMGVADNGFYDTDPSKDVLHIKACADGFNPQTILSIRLADIQKTGEYIFHTVSLADLHPTEFVVVSFEYEAVSDRTPIMIDNISVKDACEYNVLVGELNFPEAVEVMDPFTVKAEIANAGSNDMSDIKVSLMRGDEEIGASVVENLGPDQSEIVSIEATATPEWGDKAELKVVVVADNDEIEGDNMSDVFSIDILYHKMPAVTDLAADIEDDKILLAWSQPEGVGDLERRVTETFESYEHGDLDFGNWISEDKSFWGFDGVKDVIVDGNKIEIPNADDAQAFMVFEPALAGINLDDNPEWEPVSGDKLIVSFGDAANDDWESNNDWLISPELSGKQQTISFYARTAAKKGKPDDIRVMIASEIQYNNNGTVKSSCFSALDDSDINLTREWVKYEFTLPEGTKYFAIRNISDDGFAVLIDDITYEPFVVKEYANLMGYDIYRDGVRLNSSVVSEANYTVSPAMNGTYAVRAVYDEGESDMSNLVVVTDVSVGGIVRDEKADVYYDLNGFRVDNPEPGKIYIRNNQKVMIRK